MSGRVARNNLLAGIFLFGALALFMVIAMQLGNVYGMLTERRTTYVVRFSLADGAMGLKKGSIVKVGGQPVGEVTSVGFDKPDDAIEVDVRETVQLPFRRVTDDDPADARVPPEAVYVVVSVRRDVEIFHDAKVYLELPLLGSVSTINIPDVGGESFNVPAADAAGVRTRRVGRLEAWEMIPGTLAPPAFLGQAGYGADQKEQLQVILQRGSEIAQQMNDMVQSTRGSLDQTLGSLKEAAQSISETTGRVNRKMPDWIELITAALVNTRGATNEAEQRLIEARALLATVQNTVNDNRAYIDRIFRSSATATENVAVLTEKVNADLYATVKDTLADGRRALSKFADIGERADQFLVEKSPELGRTVANLRLASDQLKLAMTEVRRNPWRMLYQPTRREIEEELTFDAARTYADAVGQLRAASDAMEAAINASQAAGPTPEQRQRIGEITEEIRAAFVRYQDAERRFLDRLTRDP